MTTSPQAARAALHATIAAALLLGACSKTDENNAPTPPADMGGADMTADMPTPEDMGGADMAADMAPVDMGPPRCPGQPACAQGYDYNEFCECEAPFDRACERDEQCRATETCKQTPIGDGSSTTGVCWFDPAQLTTRVCPGPGCEGDAGDAAVYAAAASRVITPQGFETPKTKGVNSENLLAFSPKSANADVWNDCGYDMLCPGDPGYPGPDDGEGDGIAQGMWIAGFSIGRPAQLCPEEKVGCADADCCDSRFAHKDLKVQVLVMRQGGLTIAFAAIDALGFFHTDIERIKARIPASAGIDLLVMGSTHDHEAPDTVGQWGPLGLIGRDPKFLEGIRAKTVEAIVEAAGNLKAAKLHAGVVDRDITGLAMSDSRPPYIVDDNVPVVVVREAANDAPIGTLLSVGNHAESLWSKNPYLSSDFFGVARDAIRDGLPETPLAGDLDPKPALGGLGGVTVMFAGAVGGLINPGRGGGIGYDEVRVDQTGPALTRAVGQRIAANVLEAWHAGDLKEIQPDRLRFASTEYLSPIENTTFIAAGKVLRVIRRDTYNATFTGLLLSRPGPPLIRSVAHVITLGPLRFLTAPGEAFPELLVGGYPDTHTAQDPTVGDIERFRSEYLCDERGLPLANATFPCLVKPDQVNPPEWDKAPQGPYMYERIAPTDQEIPFFLGLTGDFLGYMVPPYDHKVRDNGSEADGSHYEETNSAGSTLVPDWDAATTKNLKALGLE